MRGSCRGRAQWSVIAIEGVDITRHFERVPRVCGHGHEQYDEPGRWLVFLSTFKKSNPSPRAACWTNAPPCGTVLPIVPS
jgi:hypothetical protein